MHTLRRSTTTTKYTLKLIALFSAATATALPSYTPPPDQDDGAYMVEFTSAGEPLSKRLATPISKPATAAEGAEPVKRTEFPGSSGAQTTCTHQTISSHDDYERPQTCFDNWLSVAANNWVSPAGGYVYYCRSGNALLAMCNYGGTVYGSPGEVATFTVVMIQQCGQWQSGYVWLSGWQKTYWRTMWGGMVPVFRCMRDGDC